jgi:hypothetical protein
VKVQSPPLQRACPPQQAWGTAQTWPSTAHAASTPGNCAGQLTPPLLLEDDDELLDDELLEDDEDEELLDDDDDEPPPPSPAGSTTTRPPQPAASPNSRIRSEARMRSA